MDESMGETLETEDVLYLLVEGVRYEDLAEMSLNTAERSSPEILRRRKSRRQTGKLVTVNNQKIALFKYRGAIYAMDETCPHMGGPLHVGDIEELGQAALPCVVCPWHSWKYSLETGDVKVPSRRKLRINTYPVKVGDNGELFLGFKSLSQAFFNCDEDF